MIIPTSLKRNSGKLIAEAEISCLKEYAKSLTIHIVENH